MQSAIRLDGKSFEINLNGHNLKVTDNEFFLLENGAKLKFDGSGTVSGAQKDSYSLIEIQKYVENKPNELYVGKDVTLNVKGLTGEKSNQAVVISVYAENEKVNSKIDIYGKVITDNGLGITVNGLVNSSNENVATDNVVNIYEESTVTATKGVALYQAGLSTFNVQGGTITGDESAMEVRAGTTTISGGEFKSTASTFKATSNPGGSTTVGAGLAVVQHTTTESINVTVSGGTFTGIKGLYAADVQPTGQTSKVTINLTGGTFTGDSTNADGADIDIKDNINCTIRSGVKHGDNINGVDGHVFVSTVDELRNAVNNEDVKYIKLISDLTLDDRVIIKRDLTLDLGGHKVNMIKDASSTTKVASQVFRVDGENTSTPTVTIKNGTVEALAVVQAGSENPKDTDECDAILSMYGATLTLEDLNVKVNSITGACVFARGGKVYIKSGTYENCTTGKYPYKEGWNNMCVNQYKGDNEQKIFISGGTFIGKNPADGDDNGIATTFLESGYISTKETVDGKDAYVVTAEKIEA